MFPLKYEVEYPETLSRGMLILKVLFGMVFVGIPHGLILYFLAIGAGIVQFIIFWAILFTGKIPRGMFDYVMGVNRWGMRVMAYMTFMTDKYPAFSLQPAEGDAVIFEMEYPENLSRGKLIIKILFGYFYCIIPHAVVLCFIGIGVYFVIFISFWAILFTGQYPRGMFDFVLGYFRWASRVGLYFLYPDVSPPFSLK